MCMYGTTVQHEKMYHQICEPLKTWQNRLNSIILLILPEWPFLFENCFFPNWSLETLFKGRYCFLWERILFFKHGPLLNGRKLQPAKSTLSCNLDCEIEFYMKILLEIESGLLKQAAICSGWEKISLGLQAAYFFPGAAQKIWGNWSPISSFSSLCLRMYKAP